ncbi:MAG: hypothetical protein AB7J28_06815 [Hyphomonadaceae bacterium]
MSALTQTIGLIAAIGAALAAFFTVFQVQSENRRQREMETLHLLNEQYEKIFDDIYALRAELLRNVQFTGDAKKDLEIMQKALVERVNPNDLKRAYNRFFTAVMGGFRYYELGFIPVEDYREWTATLIGRFVKKECIVRAVSLEPCPLRAQWRDFDSWGRGPRTTFRAYVNAVIAKADEFEAPADEKGRHQLLADNAAEVVTKVQRRQ